MALPDIYILRHGQTEWNLVRRFQGHRDSPLTALGRAQALRQGQILAGLGLGLAAFDVRTSPQPRALTTAELALAPLGVRALPDARLKEIALGGWEGWTRDEVAAVFPLEETDHFFWMDAAPDGEGHDAVAARASDLLGSLTRPTLLVTHGIAASHLRGQVLGLDMEATARLRGEQGVVYRLSGGREDRLG